MAARSIFLVEYAKLFGISGFVFRTSGQAFVFFLELDKKQKAPPADKQRAALLIDR
jgi:hypothetical protein